MSEEYDPKEEIEQMNEWNQGMKEPSTDPPEEPEVEPEGEEPEEPAEEPEEEKVEEEKVEEGDAETEAPSTEAPDPAQLYREELERTLREKAQLEPKEEKKEEPKEPPKTKVPSTEPPLDPDAEVDFIGDTDLDDLLQDKTSFNAMLNRVYKAGVGAGTRLGSERVLRSIPEIVQKNIQAQASLQKARDEFFSRNEDLQPYPMVVAESFNKAVADHPDWKMEQLLEETEKLSRQRLNLHSKVMIDRTKSTKNKPKFEKTPKTKGKPTKKLEGLAKELQDMIDLTKL